jgi:peptide/nickel transport system substrate-binding protein
MVPGGPAVDADKMYAQKDVQVLREYSPAKLPLWTKASYGGEIRTRVNNWTLRLFIDPQLLFLSRPSTSGMLFLLDMGRCTMIGREGKFDTCNGQPAKNDTAAIIPGVIEKWQQPDPLTYILTVRKGVLWPAIPPINRTDREVTAQDIAWFLGYVKTENFLKDNFILTKTIEAMDRYTVKITMKQPHADFLLNMAHTSMGVFPKECMSAEGKFQCLGMEWVSPGPFLLKTDELRVRGVWEKNPEFYLKGLPYFDGLIALALNDPAAQKAAWLTGQLDTYITSSVTEMTDLSKRIEGSQVEAQITNGGLGAFRFNFTGPVADARVRRALAMTMDLPSMWQAAKDGFDYFPPLVPKNYFGDEFFMYVDLAGENYQFNPTKAKQLLTEAGYGNGFTLTLNTSSSSGPVYDMFLWMQAQWKKHLNIDTKITVLDRTSLAVAFNQLKWDGIISVSGWNLTFWPDADTAFLQMVKGSRQNIEKIDDPKINDLFVKQRSEMDAAKRTAMLWEFEQYELTQIYALRYGSIANFMIHQPYEMNGASHTVAYYVVFNGPTWLGMQDLTKVPKRQ